MMEPDKVKAEERAYNKVLKGSRQRGKVADAVTPGVNTIEVDPYLLTPDRIHGAYRELLGPFIRDPEMMNVIIENSHKFKHNFTFETQIFGLNNKGVNVELGSVKDIGKRDIQSFVYDYILADGLLNKDAIIDSQWKLKAIEKLKIDGSGVNVFTEGKVTHLRTTIKYTKGKEKPALQEKLL